MKQHRCWAMIIKHIAFYRFFKGVVESQCAQGITLVGY